MSTPIVVCLCTVVAVVAFICGELFASWSQRPVDRAKDELIAMLRRHLKESQAETKNGFAHAHSILAAWQHSDELRLGILLAPASRTKDRPS